MPLDSSSDAKMQQLRIVRKKLLALHKALLDSEKGIYEQFYGKVQTTGEYFRLVTSHEWFSWLRPISQFIVQMDDVIHTKEPIAPETIDQLLQQAEQLMQPDSEGSSLNQRYLHAIQRDPQIALMHADYRRQFASQ
ncbi:hypothetical protein [Leptolyngbya ohadii]|uniref:hypothetical protein n=1 Tax=Leptolyngbya ohadii TaxID=1962290 RepID=UPI000B59DFBD|nr:hypothetical protein [Leptolyngbya ohadii]